MRARSSFVSFIGKPIDVILGRGEDQNVPELGGVGMGEGVDQSAIRPGRMPSLSADASHMRPDRMYSDRSVQSAGTPRTPPHARQSSRIRGTSVAYDAASTVGMGVSLFAFGYEKATGMNQDDVADSLMKQSDAAMSGAWDMSSLEPSELGESKEPGRQPTEDMPAVIETRVETVASAAADPPSAPQPSKGGVELATTPQASTNHGAWVKDPATGRIISRRNLLDAKI